MTSPNKVAFEIREFIYFDQNKKPIRENRLCPKDPYNVIKFGVIHWICKKSTGKVQTFNPLEPQKITGFKVITQAEHILNSINPFGTRSFSVTFENRTIYVVLNSYDYWRKLHGQDLYSLNICQPMPKDYRVIGRREEIIKMVKLLLTPLHKRPSSKPSISRANNHFEAVSAAFMWARKRINISNMMQDLQKLQETEELQEDMPCDPILVARIAAYYLLLPAELSIACTGIEELKISDNILACNASERTQKCTVYKLTEDETNLFQETSINLDCDLFSSTLVSSSPVKAKNLMIKLCKHFPGFYENFTDDLINEYYGKPISQRAFQPLIDLHKTLGLGLQSQFPTQDPFPYIFQILQESFSNLTNSYLNDFSEDTIYSISKPVCLLSTFSLLSNAVLSKENNARSLLFKNGKFEFTATIPNEIFYSSLSENMERFLPNYVSALSGHLYGETRTSIIVSEEAFDFVEAYRKVNNETFEKHFFDYLESTYFKKEANYSLPPDFGVMISQLERVSNLIQVRYWSMYEAGFYASLSFESTDENKEKKAILRTQEEQAIIAKTYLGFPLPVRTGDPDPKFDEPPAFFYGKAANAFIQHLFYQVISDPETIGDCVVGALAQGIHGEYTVDAKNGTLKMKEDLSRSKPLITRIRAGVAKYMTEHPEKIQHLMNPNKSVEIRARKIAGTAKYFQNPELTAFSFIIGRPIIVIRANQFHIKNKTIVADEINPEFKTTPLYIYLQGLHGDLLIPKCEFVP